MSFPNSDESGYSSYDESGGSGGSDTHDHSREEAEFSAQKEQILKQILMPDARSRLNNIKMVKPELSNLVEQYLIGMATQGKIRGQLTDAQLKQILLSVQQPKREFKINRI